jgi:hypothetical protein
LRTKKEKKEKYEEKKEVINQKRREKIICDCGCTIAKGYKAAHEKTKHHIDAMLLK